MAQQIVHYFVLDTLSDWEAVFAISFLNKETYQIFQAQPGRYRVKIVGESRAPITTAAGLTIIPEMTVDELEPTESAMLILPGADIWLEEARAPVLAKASAFLAAGLPVAAICGAVPGLASVGLLNYKKHTGNSLAELQQVAKYKGEELYQDQPAYTDGDLITAAAIAPLEFAYHILKKLEAYKPEVLEAWYKVYKIGDAASKAEFFAAARQAGM
ncbi:glutamine amidotransferase [Ktedonosporobacter rubrisoli]|uniref:Glutamine amidotransferase n=1 Tax=Ktedonosporobacter rubrisoli TaxID=2509675 RepID=A0A4P6JJC7_KTERU|nr:DJ-1/PfpI family protein [Ktedonosporobacter rubrisoli]QBD74766.1 glutamine amidotransferase [Ktedonosporobacter rubrisoli]